jgi:hypothetical protein
MISRRGSDIFSKSLFIIQVNTLVTFRENTGDGPNVAKIIILDPEMQSKYTVDSYAMLSLFVTRKETLTVMRAQRSPGRMTLLESKESKIR